MATCIMQVLYLPQLNEKDTLSYTFNGDVITATLNGVKDTFDFSGFTSDGTALGYGRNPDIMSTLPINPVIEVTRINGDLNVKLVNFIKSDASQAERFPDWAGV